MLSARDANFSEKLASLCSATALDFQRNLGGVVQRPLTLPGDSHFPKVTVTFHLNKPWGETRVNYNWPLKLDHMLRWKNRV